MREDIKSGKLNNEMLELEKEIHVHSIQRIAGAALHIGFENGLSVRIHKAAELRPHTDCCHCAIGDESILFNLGNYAALSHNIFKNIGGRGYFIARRADRGNKPFAPRGRLIGAKQDGRINHFAECFGQARANLTPNV